MKPKELYPGILGVIMGVGCMDPSSFAELIIGVGTIFSYFMGK